jgi:NAD(P)-dependent dehydrogenase (short-subunit alcohol dehydrogenase family)
MLLKDKTALVTGASLGMRSFADWMSRLLKIMKAGLLKQKRCLAALTLPATTRVGEVSEVAELVVWLASERANFITGNYYVADGGYLSC